MAARNYLPVPSPFALPEPPAHWLATLYEFDPDLVLFPSQKDAVYRLARRAWRSGGLTQKIFRTMGTMLHPDTKIMFDHRLVAIVAVPTGAITAPCAVLCASLRLRDTWRYGSGEDAAALALERLEADEEARTRAAWQDESRVRHRAARVGFLYRTGARVSLIAPRPSAASTVPTPAASAAPVSGQEV